MRERLNVIIEQRLGDTKFFFSLFLIFLLPGLALLPLYYYLVGYYFFLLLISCTVYCINNAPNIANSLVDGFEAAKRKQIIAVLGIIVSLIFLGYYLISYFYVSNENFNWNIKSFEYKDYTSEIYKTETGWGKGEIKQKVKRKTIGATAFWFKKNGEFIPQEFDKNSSFIINYSCNSNLVFAISFEDENDNPLTENRLYLIQPTDNGELKIALKDFEMIGDSERKFKHTKANYILVPELDRYLIRFFLTIGLEKFVLNAYASLK